MMTDDDDNESEEKNVVSIMTIHAAKGLEFNTVFLPAWEEGVFPNDKKSEEIEEERRLAYVAITRARRRAIITNALYRSLFGQRQYNSPSRFIGEIDLQFVKDETVARETHAPRRERKPRASREERAARRAARAQAYHESIVGKMVSHADMGVGVVIADNGNSLTVAFKNKGIKNVMREFVKFI